jgi:poly(3-hydroxybutyrate) depolymerase
MPRTAALLAVCVVLAGMSGCGGSDRDPGRAGPPSTAASAAAPPAPAPAPAPAPGDHKLTLAFGGNTYQYLLHAPPAFDGTKRLPLVIAMHFYPGTGAALREMIAMDAKADQAGYLIAYPDGVNSGFNALVCCGSTDDVGFLRALTAHLVDDWQVDPARVYLTGISNGGDMSFRAAVEASGTFAAIGVVSGGFIGPRTVAADYAPKTPVSVITFIGTNDRYFDSFSAGLDTWRQRQKCTPISSGPLPAGIEGTSTRARCADGSDVDTYIIKGMGHVWPGAKTGQLAGQDIPLPASELILDFFAAHPRS